MKVSENCLELIKKWEGLRLNAYIDPVGVPTIGYGTIRYPNGTKVRLGDTISEAEAEAFLQSEVDEIAESVSRLISSITINQNQFDAIISLCYNIGEGGFQGSTVLRELRAGNFSRASAAFSLWNKGEVNGVLVVIPGLVNRRNDEIALFNKASGFGAPIDIEPSLQDQVTWLEGYREAGNEHSIIVAWAGSTLIEILELTSPIKDDLISVLMHKTSLLLHPEKPYPVVNEFKSLARVMKFHLLQVHLH
jgi:lysozyme